MRIQRLGLLVLLIAVGLGCASSRRDVRFGEAAWQRHVQLKQLVSERVVYPFAATPEMEAFAAEVDKRYSGMPPLVKLNRLQLTLFDKDLFHFDYDDQLTLTAAEAFTERRGNCLAFTSLFVALARAMDIDAFLLTVQRAPEVDKQGGLVVVNRHIVAGHIEAGRLHTYDFYLSERAPYVYHRFVDDVTASAMYHTNMGGMAIREGDYDRAIENLTVATRMDPDLASAWVNLGVVRFRTGDAQAALAAYRQALLAEPGLSSALSNMAYVYRSLGQERQATAALQAAAEGRTTPFTLIALAEAEIARGNLEDANRHLKRARRSFSKEPEVYDALARLSDRKGQTKKAGKYREKAEKLRSSERRLDSGPRGASSQVESRMALSTQN